MSARHILEGDLVILEHGFKPRDNEGVAALGDNKSVVRTFVVVNGKPFLKTSHAGLINTLGGETGVCYNEADYSINDTAPATGRSH